MNTVAAEASCDIDIRYQDTAERDDILTQVKTICEKVSVEDTSSSFSIRGEFQPLNPSAQSKELFALYQESAAQDDVIVEGEHSGGCADSGFIAAAGTPVICGVGPVGGNYHRPDEWMQIDSLAQRARFIANTILRLARQPITSSL